MKTGVAHGFPLLACLALAASVGGCPLDGGGGGGGRDATGADSAAEDPGTDGTWGCGSVDHLEDPAEFVGCCTGQPDSAGDYGCIEFTTIALAPGIGTGCLVQGCQQEGGTWSGEACPGDLTLCDTVVAGDLRQVIYASNPVSCQKAQ